MAKKLKTYKREMTLLLRELEAVQRMSIAHAIAEMKAADALTLETKQERYDRGWLTVMAARSIWVGQKIEGFVQSRERRARRGSLDPEADLKTLTKATRQAKGEVGEILNRIRAKQAGVVKVDEANEGGP
ncbi:MAG TPA: hypothetical protein VFH17_07295 [Coriobacteriia bacterium]|nr:hypothetical protein [Coriobacteriia bacterium]